MADPGGGVDDWEGTEEWDPEDAMHQRLESWSRWFRDDLYVQAAAWLVATAAVMGPDGRWILWPGLASGAFSDAAALRTQLGLGWMAATLATLGRISGQVQMVFTFRQHAMTFAPGSLLLFCGGRELATGSVIIFDGCDGRSYVRRVCEVQRDQRSCLLVRTVGDAPDAPEDRPLYSPDGSASWLEEQAIRGVMAAGPFSVKVVLALACALLTFSPPFTVAFFITNQPFLAGLLALMFRLVILLLTFPLA